MVNVAASVSDSDFKSLSLTELQAELTSSPDGLAQAEAERRLLKSEDKRTSSGKSKEETPR